MGVTSVGLVAMALGAVALLFVLLPLRRARVPVAVLFGATIPMSASAAIVLPFGGGASILLSAVAAGFFCLACLPQVMREVRGGLPTAALWLLSFAAIAIAGAFLLPAAFEGATMVFALDRTAEGVTDDALKLPLVPLARGASAITQSVWLASTVAVFVAVVSIARRDLSIVGALFWGATLSQIALAALDASGWPGMAMFRTAAYEIAPDQALSGFVRLTGAATEPSQFGAVSVALAAWHLWRVRSGGWHVAAALVLIVCAAASLSTTAIATLGVVLVAAMFAAISSARSFGALTGICFGGFGVIAIGGLLVLGPFSSALNGLLEALFLDKITSESGVERGVWAVQALTNLVETYGLGTGLGSAKASGWATALLGQTGLIGMALMLAFLFAVIGGGTSDRAARAMFFAVLCAALLSEGRVDPGYLFSISAGAIVAARKPRLRPLRQGGSRHATPAF